MGRRKMKGGGDAELADPNFKNSAYKQMDNKLFLNFIFCISLMGFIWFFVSTFLVRHMYSEVLCYSLMLASVIFSLLLLTSVGVVRMSGNNFMKKFLSITMFVITKCIPGILIAVQLVIMIYLMKENALYMFSTKPEDRPQMLDIFNGATAFGLIIQMFMYRNHLSRIIIPDGNPPSAASLPGFILVGILTSWCIGQMFVILKFLKVDG